MLQLSSFLFLFLLDISSFCPEHQFNDTLTNQEIPSLRVVG